MQNSKAKSLDIITFGVNKYFNGNFDKLYSESLDFQEELHAKMIKYLMHLRDTSRPEDELDVSTDSVCYGPQIMVHNLWNLTITYR